ncbi:QCR6 subunit6 of the ubiquinol cytochrome-c reductase complex [Moniliophthora roreri MCA 2997]|uniref:QCR6 subunit6 of the ubiquinol cytochrome-c reductase complex n=2 Tax=Moniliophthora roreri TaxID=221103 RepID=V2WXK8_MONRO|nr:QCR6 subunit6 of the ubiquinol cytochrome-c reductase complex [Moniliophthora roreri MCA 2997]KAI3615882.1 QCR6 subunit6 of the ubiquinol cytochrome-c reductase complex [Moniliophthora roreri]
MSDGPGLGLTLGAAFAGGIVQTFLVALVTVQTYIFFKANTDVHYVNKWMVFLLWTLSIIHIVCVIHFSYYYLVVAGGNILGSPVWSFRAESALEILSTNLTQILYAIRLWQLTRSTAQRLIIFSVLGCLIGLNIGLNIFVPLQISKAHGFADLLNFRYAWAVRLNFSVTSAIDFVLSIALTFNLVKSARRLEWTDSGTEVVFAYALNTGIFASIFSLTCPITYVLMPENFIFLAMRIILTGLYTNSLLAMLNARYYFQKSDLIDNLNAQTNVLLYNGRGFDRRFHASSSTSARKPTINEAGLPLFQPRGERRQVTDTIQQVEVKVTKERFHDSLEV